MELIGNDTVSLIFCREMSYKNYAGINMNYLGKHFE